MTDSRLAINYPRLKRGLVEWAMLGADIPEERVLWAGYDSHRAGKRGYVGLRLIGPKVRVPPLKPRSRPCALRLRYSVDADVVPGTRVVLALNKVHMSAIVPEDGAPDARDLLLARMSLSLDRWRARADPDDALSILVDERSPGGIWHHEAKAGMSVAVLESMNFSTVIAYPIFRVQFNVYGKEPGDDIEMLECIALAAPSARIRDALEFHGVRIVSDARDTSDRSVLSGGGTENRAVVDFAVAVTSRRCEAAESPVAGYSSLETYDEPGA